MKTVCSRRCVEQAATHEDHRDGKRCHVILPTSRPS
jgi:hypothetical protein